jgi:predicted ATPase
VDIKWFRIVNCIFAKQAFIMINCITFKNYKIFKDKQTLVIKPITVIIGKNNSGKSAISKLPTLIEGSLNTNSAEALNLQNDGVILGAELRDLVYGKANRVIEFELYEENGDKLDVGILVSSENNKQQAIIDYWNLNNSVALEYSGTEDRYFEAITKNNLNCSFEGIRLQTSTKQKARAPLPEDSQFNVYTDFIGPIRAQPQRDYRFPTAFTNGKFGISGENAYYQLIADALTTDKKLVTKVGEWYKHNFEGWELKINQDKAPLFQVEIHRDELKQNILDTGIGMSQVLPIVTRALMPCEQETLVIIEEPETHLHPAAHGNLASLLVESLAQGNKKYLIETHSLNFVLRLRRLIVEKLIDRSQIGLYYVDFSEENNSSSLQKLEIDELGRVEGWPDGIFNESLEETIAIRSAQIDIQNDAS